MGEAIAKRVAHRFSHVGLHGRDHTRLASVAADVSNISECQTDMFLSEFSDIGSVKSFIEEVKKKFSHLDALILNAGMYREGDLTSFDMETLGSDFNVNLFSSWEIINGLMDLIKAGTTKRIIIIGSTAAYEPYPDVPAYGVQKWALRGFAHNLRKELMQDRIGVSFVSPGGTWTGMWEGEPLDADRLLEPNDIAVMIDASFDMSSQAVLQEVKIVPMLGDLHG